MSLTEYGTAPVAGVIYTSYSVTNYTQLLLFEIKLSTVSLCQEILKNKHCIDRTHFAKWLRVKGMFSFPLRKDIIFELLT
jgi:hypothetical protein